MSEQITERPAPKTTTADRTDNQPSVRSVAVGAASIAATFGAVAAFVIAGPIGLAVAAGVTLVGGTAVVRARRPRKTARPGLLHALIGRPRRPARTTGAGTGKLPWPLTGSQSRRGKSQGTSAGPTGRRKRTGLGVPQLPALTAKGRAKRAAAKLAANGSAHRPGTSSKRAAAPRAAIRPGGKPHGTARPSTPSRTPARAGAAKKLAAPVGKPKPLGGTGGRRTGTGARLATAGRRTGLGRGAGPTSRRTGLTRPGSTRPGGSRTGIKPGASRPVRRTGVTKPGMKFPRMSHRPTGTSRRLSNPASTRRTTRGPKAATTRAKRLGDLSTPVRRRDHRRAGAATPNRTAARPRPTTKPPTRTLMRTAMRLPRRNGWKIVRPSKVQQRKARRHLVLRGKVAGRRGAVAAVKAPFTGAKAAYRNRPLWLWPTVPKTPDPAWQIRTVPEPRLSSSPGQRRHDQNPKTRRHRTPEPILSGRRAPTGSTTTRTRPSTVTATKGTTMSSVDAVSDAFSHIANYQPQSALDFERFLAEQAQVLVTMGSAYRALAQRAGSDMPFGAAVADSIADLGSGFVGLEKIAGQLPTTLRAAHPTEFSRIEQPRPQEELFNPDRNQ